MGPRSIPDPLSRFRFLVLQRFFFLCFSARFVLRSKCVAAAVCVVLYIAVLNQPASTRAKRLDSPIAPNCLYFFVLGGGGGDARHRARPLFVCIFCRFPDPVNPSPDLVHVSTVACWLVERFFRVASSFGAPLYTFGGRKSLPRVNPGLKYSDLRGIHVGMSVVSGRSHYSWEYA